METTANTCAACGQRIEARACAVFMVRCILLPASRSAVLVVACQCCRPGQYGENTTTPGEVANRCRIRVHQPVLASNRTFVGINKRHVAIKNVANRPVARPQAAGRCALARCGGMRSVAGVRAGLARSATARRI